MWTWNSLWSQPDKECSIKMNVSRVRKNNIAEKCYFVYCCFISQRYSSSACTTALFLRSSFVNRAFLLTKTKSPFDSTCFDSCDKQKSFHSLDATKTRIPRRPTLCKKVHEWARARALIEVMTNAFTIFTAENGPFHHFFRCVLQRTETRSHNIFILQHISHVVELLSLVRRRR